jgi:hypothetical protein
MSYVEVMKELNAEYTKKGILVIGYMWCEVKDRFPRFSTLFEKIQDHIEGDKYDDTEVIPLPSTAISLITEIESSQSKEHVTDNLRTVMYNILDIQLYYLREIKKSPNPILQLYKNDFEEYAHMYFEPAIKKISDEL